MSSEAMASSSLNAWQVENLRLTAFLPTEAKVEPAKWWTDLVGYPPETVVSHPKVGRYREEGLYEGRKLSLQVQPGRVDWLLGPAVEPSEETGEGFETKPSAGPFLETLSSFVKLASGWFQLSPHVTRLAFGAVLFFPVADRRAGYVQLGKYLHSLTLDPEASDFSYQINRSRDSTIGIPGLRINRLTTWSVLLFRRFSLSLGKTAIKAGEYTTLESACRLELDINTAPEYSGVLPIELLPNLFQELVELGKEIAEKGDVP